jgi:phosphoribosyl 1,2-cyclic phosphate phosphodiesterase
MRSAALIGDDLLLDFGPDVLASAMVHGVRLTRVRYCLLTHEHADHLDTSNFAARLDACGPNGTPHLDFYASAGALQTAAHRLGIPRPDGLRDSLVAERLNLTAHPIAPFETLELGRYRARSFRANHGDGNIVPLVYVVELGHRTVFYCVDTGPLPEETWQALAALPAPIDVVVMDHTFGLKAAPAGHLNLAQFVAQIDRLREIRALAPTARIFAHHLGHHSNPPHPQLVDVLAPHGFEVAYDGLTVEV